MSLWTCKNAVSLTQINLCMSQFRFSSLLLLRVSLHLSPSSSVWRHVNWPRRNEIVKDLHLLASRPLKSTELWGNSIRTPSLFNSFSITSFTTYDRVRSCVSEIYFHHLQKGGCTLWSTHYFTHYSTRPQLLCTFLPTLLFQGHSLFHHSLHFDLWVLTMASLHLLYHRTLTNLLLVTFWLEHLISQVKSLLGVLHHPNLLEHYLQITHLRCFL